MPIAEVMTPWVGSGTDEDPYRPGVRDAYPAVRAPGRGWVDATNQPTQSLEPDPNLTIVQIRAPRAVLEAIDADPEYGLVESRQRMRDRLQRAGLTPAQRRQVVGDGEYTRSEAKARLRQWLKGRPKKARAKAQTIRRG